MLLLLEVRILGEQLKIDRGMKAAGKKTTYLQKKLMTGSFELDQNTSKAHNFALKWRSCDLIILKIP